jgi:tetratricopeptide (TPR) repeat protein/2-polyprenyl-3-methyl-5-hydroxy-6-metoxy-1,4-benzoquinol methylase
MAIGRNQPCPCGSGRKYKHCCGAPAGQAPQGPGAASPAEGRAQTLAQTSAQVLASASGLLQSGQLAQAERLYRQVLDGDAANVQATHYLGMCLLQAGRPDEGMAALRRSVALAPANDVFWLNMGMALVQLNELGEAEASLRHALSAKPDSAAAHNYLGVLLLRTARYGEAVMSFERALALNPGDDAIHNNFGYARLEHGEVKAAHAHFRRAIEINPKNAMAHNNLGNALRGLGELAASMASYRRAAEIDPANPMARFNLGRALVDAGQPEAALVHLRAAVRLAPQAGATWQWLGGVLAQRRFDAPDAGIEGELLECLSRPDIAPDDLAPAAASLLRADPSFHLLLAPSDGEGPRALALDEAALRPLARPLFLQLLENVVIPEPDFEQLIANIRRAAILAWRAGDLPGGAALRELLGAIAHQCFLAEYLHEERDDESPVVGQLKARVEAQLAQGESVNEAQIALFACYRGLAALQGADKLPASNASIVGRLALRQVREPADEAAIAVDLPRLTPIRDEVSRAVQAQYEERPYPRWLRARATGGAHPLALRLRMLFPHADKTFAVPERPSILIAGCGTGWHVALTAPPNPDSRILAIDLSRASLAYAARRAQQSGFRNVEFAQADILELGGLAERFDVIECAGVLHHLNDPVAGWRVLLGLLAPGGKMKVALYSEIARRGVVAARRLITARGFAADLRGMRAARAAILALPPDDPARLVARTVDFYTQSGCRDLLFHVQEHRYTLAGIAAMLGDLELDLLGFEFEYATTLLEYRREFPQDPAATALANWAEFETRHPDTFNAMYQFWVTPRA